MVNTVQQLSRDEYDSIRALNFSTLSRMGVSPRACQYYTEHGGGDSPALARGRLVHMAVFEPDAYDAEVSVWQGSRRAGKAWEAFQAAHHGRTIVTIREHDEAMAIRDAVRCDRHARAYLESTGQREVTMTWNVAEVPCKGRLDLLTDDYHVDLKVTKNPAPGAFAAQAARLQYHARHAWYDEGVQRAAGRRVHHRIIAVHADPPHDVVVYHVPRVAIDAGRRLWRRWLDRWRECHAIGRWPGLGETEQILNLPEWALPEVELTIGGERAVV